MRGMQPNYWVLMSMFILLQLLAWLVNAMYPLRGYITWFEIFTAIGIGILASGTMMLLELKRRFGEVVSKLTNIVVSVPGANLAILKEVGKPENIWDRIPDVYIELPYRRRNFVDSLAKKTIWERCEPHIWCADFTTASELDQLLTRTQQEIVLLVRENLPRITIYLVHVMPTPVYPVHRRAIQFGYTRENKETNLHAIEFADVHWAN